LGCLGAGFTLKVALIDKSENIKHGGNVAQNFALCDCVRTWGAFLRIAKGSGGTYALKTPAGHAGDLAFKLQRHQTGL
jgi:hypothetical protein